MSKPSITNLEANTRDIFGINVLTSRHKAIRRLKRAEHSPSLHGNKLWGSSYLIMDYLLENPPEQALNVLELGCGWGLAGIFCAKHYDAKVDALDADPAVFPYLEMQAQYNHVSINTKQQNFADITASELAGYDLIIAADICFWDELADIVYDLIRLACKAEVRKIVIADPERPPFFNMALRCINDFYAELIPRHINGPRNTSGCLLVIENN